ncbi:MAG: flagellar motor protein MotB [Caulobacteraceae bacterium]|nr:flagellar motor protein MotB [Caulobacteraceae bacterium]
MSKILERVGVAILVAAGLSACSSLPKMGGGSVFKWPSTRSQIEQAPNPCIPFSVSVYFADNVSSLTRENRAVLNSAAGQTQGCKLNSVNVVGLSDPTGSPAANLVLSQKRAEAVRQALSAGGLGGVTFDAAGAAGAAKPSGQVEPLRRRADVLISLSPMP